MTKKDYILLASAIAEVFRDSTPVERDAVYRVTKRLAARLKDENPRFDPERFLRVCRDEV